MAAFDTVFSMGILYHRRSPMDHLRELRQLLKPGGQLVLETLVIEGDGGPAVGAGQDRYAKMPNVWFIPSPDMLIALDAQEWPERIRAWSISAPPPSKSSARPTG